ncbi:MAG TPA: DUF4352 domain-containing protein [Acidimicrobiia bacterium]|nr:DUF4352 domain-containing protein [Acidimicrobiia bacterium]
MQVRTDRGWIKAGLAVLVTGLLGGGVLAAAGGSPPAQKVTADGVTDKDAPAAASAGQGFDLGGVRPAGADEAPEAEAGPVVGDKVPMGEGSVTVSAVEDNVNAGRLFGAGKGFKYIAAEVKGCSGPNEKNITFEPAYFLLRLDDGTIRDPGIDAKKPSLDGGTVPPGKCLSGWVTFTVPEGALPTGVIYDGSVRTTWTVPLPKNAKQTTTTTVKAGATTETTADDEDEADGSDGSSGSTSTSTRLKSTTTTSKSTATTAKPTPTTARGSTATTSKSTASTGKSTATTGKSSASSSTSTSTTAKSSASGSGSTTTTSKSSSSSSTTTTAKSSGSTPTTSKATTTSTAGGNG